MAADKNLLLGILALQLDFITGDQLIAGMNAWVREKETPLEDIFIRQGALNEKSRDLLVALVAKHLEMHSGDPEKSLASVSSIGEAREELQSLEDTEVNATLNFVSNTRAASDRQSIPSRGGRELSTADAGKPTTRFKVIRPHAKGGLGEVFVAIDQELNREVALKEVQAKFAEAEDSRARFRLEAEITGNLEHPGIVPVYGLGQYADGRPFYAMRFIRGDSLKEAIQKFHDRFPSQPDRRISDGDASLELRKLLGRFVDICNAVEYAHSRGVLHRDLKPGNIVLGKYGETLVVDWGLAKAAGTAPATPHSLGPVTPSGGSSSGSAPTMLGSIIGTPAYMSPEQAGGRVDELGPATDVYSLGATLFHLLTGQTPVEGKSLAETLQRVQAGDFPPLRDIREDVPRVLEAICLKAMAREPDCRYPSPIALADDIERWLGDEPVAAFPDPIQERVKRWIRKHQTLAATTAAAALLTLLGMVVITTIVSGKNAELTTLNNSLDAKNRELIAANERERQATILATKNQELAGENADVAREQSSLALASLESVITEIQAKLRFIPGSADLRHELLQTALTQLEGVSSKFASREVIDRQTMLALNDLGGLFIQIGANASDSGEPPLASAGKTYEQAFNIAQQLARAQPESAEAQRDLARAYSLRGDLEYELGNFSESLEAYEESLAIRRMLAALDPSDIQLEDDEQSREVAQHELALSYYDVGYMQFEAGNIEKARVFFDKVLEIRKVLAKANPEDIESQGRLVHGFEQLSDVAASAGDLEVAMEHLQTALKISEEIALAAPDDPRSQKGLADVYSRQGNLLLNLNKYEASLVPYKKALSIHERIAVIDPDDLSQQSKLSMAHSRLGDAALRALVPEDAVEPYRKAAEINKRIAAADPSDAQARFGLYISYHKAAATQQTQKRFSEAVATYQRGLDVLNSLKAENRLSKSNEQWISVVENAIRQCRISPIAFGDWDTLLAQPKDELPAILELRGQHFVTEEKITEAAQAVAKLRELGTGTAEQLYNAAGVLNGCATRVELNEDGPSSQSEAYIADGIETLKEAIKAGFSDFVRIKNDPYLNSFRSKPEFQTLIPDTIELEPPN